MSGAGLKQRLAAILAADAAGYSRLMAADERATVAALDSARAVFRTRIESTGGPVIDMAGDSVLAVFETATGAVSAALAIQRQLAAASGGVPEDRRMRFRIGVHLGDIIEKADGTIYGDGYVSKGLLLVYASERDRMGDALTNLRRAHELNPHDMRALVALGFGETIAGNPEKAIEHLLQALRLSPRDPAQSQTYNLLAMASVCAGQYANGVQCALRGIGEVPREPGLHSFLAANYVGLGEIAKAKAAMEAARGIAPAWAQRLLAGGSMFRKPEDLRRLTVFFRVAAGLEDPSAADGLR